MRERSYIFTTENLEKRLTLIIVVHEASLYILSLLGRTQSMRSYLSRPNKVWIDDGEVCIISFYQL